MIFTKVRLDGRSNIDLPFFGLRPTSNFILKAADGLGPPEIDVMIEDGVYLQRTPQNREIILRVGLNPSFASGQSAGSMRDRLYGLLSPRSGDAIFVRLMNGPIEKAFTKGFVKKIEIVPFTKTPEVQVVVACLSPYLEHPQSISKEPGKHANFTIDNIGTVSTGFFMEMKFTANRDYFLLSSSPGNAGARLRLNFNFQDNDRVKIRTTAGGRYVYVERGNNNINIIRALTSDSVWFDLHPGENHFWVEPAATNWDRFVYTPLYWGI